MAVRQISVPPGTLIAQASEGQGAHGDAFTARVAGRFALADFIQVFYKTPIFRAERAILSVALRRRIPDAEVDRLAEGSPDFAVWRVEARREDEILLADTSGATKSWLCVQSAGPDTQLFFGSVVMPTGAATKIGVGFKALMGLHLLYSRILLGAAAQRLMRSA